jgi:hypothetical protein
MVRRLAIAAALLLACAATAAADGVDLLDRQDGFRDARFGARVETFQGLEPLGRGSAAPTRFYVRPGDDLHFGAASLDGVSYGFFEGELYFVALFSSGRRNNDAVLAALEQSYGPGRALAGDVREYVWAGERVLLHFRVDPATSMAMVGLTSLPIDRRAKAALAATLPANGE